ncbi:putative GLUT4 regulating protein TUG-domain-containing protein [Seiridium cardinale]
MSTTVKVVSTDMRQAPIKVNPSTYLIDVLEQACKKFNLTPDKYLLKHKEKELDLSNTFRNSGLIAGAKLELITKAKTPSVLNIALQLPEPEAKAFGAPRATAKLPSDTTVWKVLRHFESTVCSNKVVITARGVPQTGVSSGSGQLYYETPTLQMESRSLTSFVDFQKTMSQLGYNKGNVLIRLGFQKTDKTFMEAMSNISQYFDEEASVQQERDAASAEASKAESEALSKSVQQAPEPLQEATDRAPVSHESTTQVPEEITDSTAPEAMDIDSTPSNPLAPTSIFSAPKNSTPAAASVVVSDEVYVPGIAHAQLHQQRLKHEGMNKRLLSDRELEEKAAAEAAKLAAVKSIDVRVRFPDQASAQWKITPDWTGAKLYSAVRSVMAHEEPKFRLVLPGSPVVTIGDDDGASHKLVKGYGFRHNTLVNLVWDDSVSDQVRKQPFLKEAFRSKAVEVVVPEVPQGEEEDQPARTHAAQPATQRRDDDGEGRRKGMPKWLKLAK